MDLFPLAQRVRRGVQLLDKVVPRWRTVLRKHEDSFDFSDGSYCVLGTLEHYAGRKAVEKLRRRIDVDDYPTEYGFDGGETENRYDEDVMALEDLWRAEFQQ